MIDNKRQNLQKTNKEERYDFTKTVWIILLLGGLFMIYGGVLDIMVYFNATLPFAPPSWHTVDTEVSLVCGIIVLFMAVYLIVKSIEVKTIIEEKRESEITPLIKALMIVCITGTIADLIAGYYARGFLVSMLGLIYLNYSLGKQNKAIFLFLSLKVITSIAIGFIWTVGI